MTPIYKNNLISNSESETIPLLNYNRVTNYIEKFGLDTSLLKLPELILQTSGSTDKPKILYYTWNDLNAPAELYHEIFLYLGLNDSMSLWEMSAWIPFMSGPLSKVVSDTFQATNDILFSPIENQKDMIKTIRTVSKGDYHFNVVSMPVLFYYILSQVIENPNFMYEIISNNIKFKLPHPILKLLTMLVGRGIKPTKIKTAIENVDYAICSAAPVGPYRSILNKILPNAKIIDLWASTENACMGLKSPDSSGHYLLIDLIVPEILPISEMIKLNEDPEYLAKTIPLSDWKPGNKGELIISRDGDCLPLLRYRTGDEIEVIKQFEDAENSGPFSFKPLVKLLGRSAEKIDFFDPEQWGPYHGDEIYFSDIDSALDHISSIQWWELYATHEVPRRLVLIIIPNIETKGLKKTVLKNLLNNMN